MLWKFRKRFISILQKCLTLSNSPSTLIRLSHPFISYGAFTLAQFRRRFCNKLACLEMKKNILSKTCKLNAKSRAKFANVSAPLSRVEDFFLKMSFLECVCVCVIARVKSSPERFKAYALFKCLNMWLQGDFKQISYICKILRQLSFVPFP